MIALVARQPILDKNLNIFSYELLFRGKDSESFNGEQATAQVIMNTLESIGFTNLTEGQPAFINFTDELLKQGIPDLLAPEMVYIEVLETVTVDQKLLSGLETYKEMGFKIVLDDFVFSEDLIPLIKLADYIKIDFIITKGAERKKIITICNQYNSDIQYIAEKVETYDEFFAAKDMGFDYFQGFFFTKPKIIKAKKTNSYALTFFKMIKELNKDEPKTKKIEEIIKSDLSMSYSLLRIINSAHYGYDVKSIRQAIVLLGVEKLKKWSLLYFLKGLDNNKPDILFKTAVLRANFAESLTDYFGDNRGDNLFVLGLLSVIDAYLDRKLENILAEISLSNNLKEALIKREGQLGDLLLFIEAFEKLNLKEAENYIEKYSINYGMVFDNYSTALEKTKDIVEAFENNKL
ncbi:EAL and HDOD domain-containing protein [Halanaerobium congolense]|uniref:EAL and HDOD domain-containing protein n=1 Tax=Halanaerobium congolense TaxID=54121 RepID=UPI000880E7DD|nr:HDOD domain-containing protein [Halanaerobium congolense]SDK31643.1 EAL and modified HD-GYP domain-containing signal transduction protein [Halanaerobium congolense]SDL94579.1 EAL and modified HD-GYP domain-containing signal transduction protein [Halanaerobium congolense]